MTTEQTPDPEQTPEAEETPEAEIPETTPSEPEQQDPTPEPSGIAEAKKYRQRAQDAEAERDRLRAGLSATRTALARTVVGNIEHQGKRVRPEAVDEVLGDDPTIWYTDTGDIDIEKLSARVAEIADTRPHWLDRRFGNVARKEGGTVEQHHRPTGNWAAAFGPKPE